jgi:hypothetical protein
MTKPPQGLFFMGERAKLALQSEQIKKSKARSAGFV